MGFWPSPILVAGERHLGFHRKTVEDAVLVGQDLEEEPHLAEEVHRATRRRAAGRLGKSEREHVGESMHPLNLHLCWPGGSGTWVRAV